MYQAAWPNITRDARTLYFYRTFGEQSQAVTARRLTSVFCCSPSAAASLSSALQMPAGLFSWLTGSPSALLGFRRNKCVSKCLRCAATRKLHKGCHRQGRASSPATTFSRALYSRIVILALTRSLLTSMRAPKLCPVAQWPSFSKCRGPIPNDRKG